MTEAGTTVSSVRRAALVAGGGLLVMTLVFVVADYLVFQSLVVTEDGAQTTNAIAASPAQFRGGILGYFVVLVLDVVVAWALYVFFEPQRRLSLLAAWLRLMYAALLGVALLALVGVALLVSDAGYSESFETAQLHATVMLLLDAFNAMWGVALLVFALHLLLLGYLAFRSGYVPRVLAVLVMIGGASYAIEYTAKLVFPDLVLPVTILGWGELVFAIWLLWKGGKRA